MSKIKICGLFREEDIAAVNEARPDYAGFVFAPSRRQVSPERAARLIGKLSPGILPVGVFVNEIPARAARIAEIAGLAVIQLHGDEDGGYVGHLRRFTGLELWKAVRVRNAASLSTIDSYHVERFLLDAYSEQAYGGCGEPFCWDLIRGIDREKLILAGGLNASNLEQAVKTVRPYCVDLSSGAETGGLKDAEKMKQLVSIVRKVEYHE